MAVGKTTFGTMPLRSSSVSGASSGSSVRASTSRRVVGVQDHRAGGVVHVAAAARSRGRASPGDAVVDQQPALGHADRRRPGADLQLPRRGTRTGRPSGARASGSGRATSACDRRRPARRRSRSRARSSVTPGGQVVALALARSSRGPTSAGAAWRRRARPSGPGTGSGKNTTSLLGNRLRSVSSASSYAKCTGPRRRQSAGPRDGEGRPRPERAEGDVGHDVQPERRRSR